jgi:hypothetical protein
LLRGTRMRGPSGFTIQGQVNSMGPTVYCVFDELVRGRYMATFQGDLDGWAQSGLVGWDIQHVDTCADGVAYRIWVIVAMSVLSGGNLRDSRA